jgi:hypothetical protein
VREVLSAETLPPLFGTGARARATVVEYRPAAFMFGLLVESLPSLN